MMLVASVVIFGGCGDKPSIEGKDTETLSPSGDVARMYVPDVPVPIGFKLDEGHSRHFATGGARYVDHVYKGTVDKMEVVKFYRREMPSHRWGGMEEQLVQGNVIMDFENNKTPEHCRVIVGGGGNIFNPTKIQIHLWARGRLVPPLAPKTSE